MTTYEQMVAGAVYGPEQLPEESIMPGPLEAFIWGAMGVSHQKGLRSGGLLGYSTFFVGAGPGAGAARQMSLGHAALRALSVAARGVQVTGLGRSNRAFQRLLQVAIEEGPRSGLAGMAGSLALQGYRAPGRLFQNSEVGFHYGGRQFLLQDGAWYEKAADGSAALLSKESIDELRKNTYLSRMLGTTSGEGLREAHQAYVDRELTRRLRRSTGVRALAAAGGIEFTGLRAAAGTRGAAVTTIDYEHKGAMLLRGTAGKFIGASIKAIGWLEGIELATQLASAGVVSAYGSMSRTVERLQGQFNPRSMSAGYFNQAAATERQRALQELNDSVLQSRKQLMGNEAYFMHR